MTLIVSWLCLGIWELAWTQVHVRGPFILYFGPPGSKSEYSHLLTTDDIFLKNYICMLNVKCHTKRMVYHANVNVYLTHIIFPPIRQPIDASSHPLSIYPNPSMYRSFHPSVIYPHLSMYWCIHPSFIYLCWSVYCVCVFLIDICWKWFWWN